MSSSIFIAALAALAPLLPSVSAHGQLAAAEAAGTVYQAPNVYYAPAERNAGTPLSAMYPSNGKAWNGVGDFGDANAMACEGAAVPPGQITVTSGGAIRYYFNGATSELLDRVAAAFKVDDTPYPFVHAMGSVAVDIASCGGDCANVNPADLNWNRILYDGLDYGATVDGGVKAAMAAKPEPYQGDARWGLAALIARGSWVEAIIPADLVAGNYLTRVELAAVHDPKKPQLYIGCANTVVQGAGTKALTGGTNAGALYSSGGALAQLDVYSNGWSFNGDGPALLDFASTPSTNTGSNNSGSSGNSDNSDSSDSGSDNTDTDTEKPTEEAAPTTEASTPAASTEEPAAAESSAAPSSCRRRRRRNVTKRASSAHKRAAFPHMHSL